MHCSFLIHIRFSFAIKFLKKHAFTFFFLFSCLPGTHQSYGEESISNNWFDIKSKTALVSAQCIIDGSDQDQDKTRKTVGVGEEITLTTEGKALKDSNVVVEWKLVSGENVATLQINPRDSTSAKLTIKNDAKNDGNVTVEAKAKKDDEEIAFKEINFETRVPSGIKAKPSGLRMEDHPVDGDRVNVGTSSKLILILEPLSVNFTKIYIREKAEDSSNDVENNWIGAHDTGDKASAPDDRNEVKYDSIGVQGTTVEQIQGWEHLGQQSVWKCGWYTYTANNNGYHCKISNNHYQQVFVITEDGQRPNENIKEIKAFISKFGCTTTRSTAGTASHKDTP